MEAEWKSIMEANNAIAPRCVARVTRDIKDIVNNPPPGIFALPDEENMRLMNVLIIGPDNTPNQGGMFSFLVGFTDNYPMKPPKVKLLTTGEGKVRFNPNLYADGLVCLSILGTFSGPGWSPVMNLSSVMVSVQSLMNEEPYRNEPGYEKASLAKVKQYNDIILHETIRIAVVDVMERKDDYHAYFVEKIEATFDQHYDYYVKVCKENIHLEGEMIDPFAESSRGKYQYDVLLEKLESLKNQRKS